MKDDLEDLLKVTRILRERALEAYRKDLSEEAQLKTERDQIDAMRDAARQGFAEIDARQMLGADMQWQGWLVRRRSEINHGMAMARAKQAHSGAAARLAFSRDEAAKDVAKKAEDKARAARVSAEESSLERLAALMRVRSEPD